MTPVVDVPAQTDTAELRVGEKVLALPVEQAVAGQSAINIGPRLKDGHPNADFYSGLIYRAAWHDGSVPYDLDRFLVAQQPVYDAVLDELRRGRKTSHWMWFVFPQIAGLGYSAMAQRFAIASLDEARAYLAHAVLGARLRECAELVLATRGRTAEEIFGSTDALKLRSCMTLFHRAAPDEPVFARMLDRFYGGVADEATDALLG
jgi:uncharacterized protein (DUF1810 family)